MSTCLSLRVVRGLILLGALLVTVLSSPLQAQQRDSLSALSGDMTPREIQRLFEAFELVRAQEMLDLSGEQYPEFVARFTVLQDARRRGQQERQRRLRELQQMSNQPGADEAMLSEQLEALSRHDREVTARQRAAIAEIDAILTIRQQVRFRMFEQAMERRRVDLLMRARRQPPRR